MQLSHYDQELNEHYGRDNFKLKKKNPSVVMVKNPTAGNLPLTLEVNGKTMIKTSSHPLSKKQAKKEAKKAAKASGLKGASIRKAGRLAAQSVTAQKLMNKASTTGDTKKAHRLLKHAASIQARKGKTAVGIAAKKVAKGLSLTPLVPLMGVMGLSLRKKGFTPPKKVEDRAELFYNQIVAPSTGTVQQNFDGYNDDHLAADIVISIVKFVKNAIDKRKAAKAGQGAALSPVEELVAVEGEKVVKNLSDKAAKAGMTNEDIQNLPSSNSKDSDGGAMTSEEKSEKVEQPDKKSSSKIFGLSPKVAGGLALGGLALLFIIKKA